MIRSTQVGRSAVAVPLFMRVIGATKLETPSAVPRWRAYLLPAALAALALAVRLPYLGRNGLLLDEGVSASIAELPWTDFFKLWWRREANMGFYYLLLRGWSSLGESEFNLRLLSVALGAASIIAVWLLGKRLFGSQAGLIAGLLLAINAFHLRYSQQARGYALVMLLVTLSTLFLVRVLEQPSRRNRRFYLAVSTLAFYTHFFAVLVIAAQLMALLLFDRERSRSVGMRSVWAWMIVLFAPGVLFLLLKNQGQLDWIPPLTLGSFHDSISLFAGQGGAWLLLAYSAPCVAAVITIARRSPGAEAQTFGVQLMAIWLFLPMVVLLLASIMKPLFVPRYLALCLPALALLAGAGMVKAMPAVRMAAVLVLAALSMLGVRNYFSGLPAEREEWREVTQYVRSNVKVGDGLIFDNGVARPVFEYYRRDSTWPEVLFPAHGAKLTYRDFEGVPTPQVLPSRTANRQRVWLVARSRNIQLEQSMAEFFEKIEEREFRGATVQLYVRLPK